MKTALVTGTSSGIGLAIARHLHALGVAVTGIARRSQNPDFELRSVRLDLADLNGLADALSHQPEFKQNFDLLVLNAGYGRFGGLENFSYAQISHLINTNLVSNLFLLKHFLPRMKRQGGKDIVLMGSESALAGGRQGSVYCASKFGLRGLAQSLQADCAAANIRVLLINPGPVDTEFFDQLGFAPELGSEYALQAEEVAESVIAALQQPRDMAVPEINLQPQKRVFRKK